MPAHRTRQLRWIAWYNLIKGAILLTLAIGLLGLMHKDLDEVVSGWIGRLGLDLENRHVEALLTRLDLVTARQVGQLSGLTFFLATLFLAEGVGLLLDLRWAKYLTIVVTASFIPVEIFEMFHGIGAGKIILLAVNTAIVALLVAALRRETSRRGRTFQCRWHAGRF